MDLKQLIFLPYNTTGAIPYTLSGWVNMVDNCNGWLAVNTGDDPVEINDQILYPGIIGTSLGDAKPVGGNFGEIFKGTIKITFKGIGANPQVTIEQKYYMIDKTLIDKYSIY